MCICVCVESNGILDISSAKPQTNHKTRPHSQTGAFLLKYQPSQRASLPGQSAGAGPRGSSGQTGSAPIPPVADGPAGDRVPPCDWLPGSLAPDGHYGARIPVFWCFSLRGHRAVVRPSRAGVSRAGCFRRLGRRRAGPGASLLAARLRLGLSRWVRERVVGLELIVLRLRVGGLKRAVLCYRKVVWRLRGNLRPWVYLLFLNCGTV